MSTMTQLINAVTIRPRTKLELARRLDIAEVRVNALVAMAISRGRLMMDGRKVTLAK